MQDFSLSPTTKKRIMRRVWFAWMVRAFWPVTVLASVVVFESFMVSIPQIARASIEATASFSTFGAYWVSAFAGAEFYVYAGIAIFLFACYGTIRNMMRGLYKKENLMARERVI